MKIHPVEVEMFHADRETGRQAKRWTDGHVDASSRFLAILRMLQKRLTYSFSIR
jgi:hypothetical protein